MINYLRGLTIDQMFAEYEQKSSFCISKREILDQGYLVAASLKVRALKKLGEDENNIRKKAFNKVSRGDNRIGKVLKR